METILKEAYEKGKVALQNCIPNPVGFYTADLSGNATSPIRVEEEGNCGGAYVSGIKGNDTIVKWFKRNGEFDNSHNYSYGDFTLRKGVYKGYELSIYMNPVYNGQSHEKKKAFVDAFVEVLKQNNIKCFTKDYLT